MLLNFLIESNLSFLCILDFINRGLIIVDRVQQLLFVLKARGLHDQDAAIPICLIESLEIVFFKIELREPLNLSLVHFNLVLRIKHPIILSLDIYNCNSSIGHLDSLAVQADVYFLFNFYQLPSRFPGCRIQNLDCLAEVFNVVVLATKDVEIRIHAAT